MHLVIGAGEFLGDHVSHALAGEVPVIALNADADDETLSDAISAIEVVHICAETWSPARRLHYRRAVPSLLKRVVEAARRAGVRRIVHVSTADVFGPNHFARVTEKTKLHPVHAYERLKLFEERWLLDAAQDLEVVIVRHPGCSGRERTGDHSAQAHGLPREWTAVAAGRGRSLADFVAAF